jgi:hypothetical protein
MVNMLSLLWLLVRRHKAISTTTSINQSTEEGSMAHDIPKFSG